MVRCPWERRRGFGRGLGPEDGLLAALAATSNPAVVIALLDELCAEPDSLPAALDAARAAGDARLADALLHSIKGAAATLGLTAAAGRAQVLREAGAWTMTEAEQVRSAAHGGADRARTLLRSAGFAHRAA